METKRQQEPLENPNWHVCCNSPLLVIRLLLFLATSHLLARTWTKLSALSSSYSALIISLLKSNRLSSTVKTLTQSISSNAKSSISKICLISRNKASILKTSPSISPNLNKRITPSLEQLVLKSFRNWCGRIEKWRKKSSSYRSKLKDQKCPSTQGHLVTNKNERKSSLSTICHRQEGLLQRAAHKQIQDYQVL